MLDSRLAEDRSRWILAALSWFGVVVIVTWLLLMLTFAVAALAADRWAVYETIDGKTRIWRLGVTDGYPGAIKKTEGECSAMLQLAQWSHADEVARANRARTARGLEPIGAWAKYECRPYR